ncbi:phosphohistidine phosphatase SixA [Rubidibacter lacunae KORDI 51-2]|uniref:Phosphohistidine phosphatase SixA n=1 Tax=Rubidibacter lacunae KORDI 51-2 TaxID=582515 RepID=U5DP40_9CHRO|nr:phosphohistidine phosphatase SixA [Rubidibacter lacunae]ERN41475.1 phosphohistidine phosphatase SixA [Rubidibacter lacunae KORDI 51-2]
MPDRAQPVDLYFIRHGIAADRADYTRDADRPLTNRGRERTTRVASRLLELDIHFDRLLTSPLVRARQTADILKDLGLGTTVEIHPALAPGGAIADWLTWWEQRPSGSNTAAPAIALVGHQPDLGEWAETMVWGTACGKLPIKKAGIVCIRIPAAADPRGRGELLLAVGPKWILPSPL